MTVSADAAATRHGRGHGVKSKEARSIALQLLDVPIEPRRSYLNTLSEKERAFVFAEVLRETGTLYGLWHDSPSAFIEDVLGETLWSRQKVFLDAIVRPEIKRVIVPAGFGIGKTWSSGRLTAWAGAVNPIGSMTIVTTATRMRQVRSQLWPHIKTAVAKGKLPGRTDTIQWIAPDMYGIDKQVAYGFTAPANDEAALQGVHGDPKLLIIVDEAGGIAPLIGKGTNNLLTGDAKLLAIGNPAMNEPGSWFEGAAADGDDPEERTTTTVQISTLDSPAITGEPTPICRSCVPNLDGHTIAGGVPSHLPDWAWLRNTLREYGVIVPPNMRDREQIRELGRESGQPYVIAKVLAEFPRDTGNQVMPSSWVDAAEAVEDPTGEEYVRPIDLELPGEFDTFTVKKGAWVRLGVDVAADGGDEFAVYRMVGDVIHQRHTSSGAQNADPLRVAEKILAEIEAAEKLRVALGTPQPVRVKIDRNGLGWGVVGILERWRKSGRHKADIVGVMVSESPHVDDEAAVMRPWRKRDEMWLTGRFLLQPDPSTGYGRLRLRLDHKAKIQLSLPRLGNNSSGYTVIESKDSMRKRGLSSPDRGEAAILSFYEPIPVGRRKGRGLLN